MARLPRISPPDIPVHVIQRGNNRQASFVADEDHAAYVGWLKDYSKKYNVEIHAWVMMTNRVHLLCTPRQEGGISQMMQSVGRRYVQYFNFKYRRSGTLWEGRFKICRWEVIRQIDNKIIVSFLLTMSKVNCWKKYEPIRTKVWRLEMINLKKSWRH